MINIHQSKSRLEGKMGKETTTFSFLDRRLFSAFGIGSAGR